MPPLPHSSVGLPELTIREPAPAEVGRVRYLFRNLPLPPEAQLLAAVRSRPVERFIAAVAWWPEGTAGRFHLACQLGVPRAAVAGPLLDRLGDCARGAGMRSIQCATLLADDHEWFEILRRHGLGCLRSERSFEVPYRDAWRRVMQLYQKHREHIPAGWRTDPIRWHAPETALELIAPHRLMPPAEVRGYWQAESPLGFDLDLSCLLFDGERPFGAFLARRMGEGLYIDVQVVRQPNPCLRSLGDLLMLYHDAQRVPADGPLRWIWFRSGATEHRQTANLAFRLGGRELSQCHLLARSLENEAA